MRQHQAAPRGPSGTANRAIASEQDRVRQFRAARRHTWFVRTWRTLLPVLALVALGAYGARLVATSMLRPMGVEIQSVRIDAKNLVMETPKYDGFGKDGARYQVRAREAITDIRQSGPVRLNAIEGDIFALTGGVTKLTAVWGTYDQKKDLLELYERIDIDGSAGLAARLTRATVLPKLNQISSDQPVWARNDTGTITAKSMTLDTKSRRATFKDTVHVLLDAKRPAPGAPSDSAKASAAKSKTGTLGPGLGADSGQPIDVRSDALDMDDGAKTALFRRNVVATQADATLEAPELDILYVGKAAIDATTKPATADDATKLQAIRARGGVTTRNKDDRTQSETLDYDAATERAVLRGNVVLTSGTDRRVTAKVVHFDQKADSALMTGDVIATQGRNVLQGQRLRVDRRQSTTRLDSPAEDGQPAGRINTLFYQAEPKPGAKPGPAKSNAFPGDNSIGLGIDFKTDPNAPIEVDADSLDVYELKKNALFRGNVVAKQGDFTVRTIEMTAFFTGQTGLGSTPSPTDKGEAGGAQLTRIETRQKVVVTSKDGREVIGDWADFDVKANTVIVGGRVVVSNGKSTIDGPDGSRLIVDMTSGKSHFEHAPSAKPANGDKGQPAVSASAPTGSAAATAATRTGVEPCLEGLVCAKKQFRLVLYPKQVEEKAKEQLDKATRDGLVPADIAKDLAQGKKPRRSKPEASSWDSTTTSTTTTPPASAAR